ncbi:hypothetical protein DSL64_25285 [Dyadobacter luteus]|uniref:Glycosyl transferase n=1 Tax=Dyadobacter luteus TaxID=2259619 RepID=A0A3D8Y4F6_9BACT|nr:hypothetical protein [Dyadobacter luteus]REA56969.1 hypothetical protein DSL64_25285 [Dyadobacter luteus]
MNIIFTVCNRTSLAHALALAKSVMQYPGNLFYLGWVDYTELTDLPAYIKLIRPDEVAIPKWQHMTEQYYDFELVNACRPWFLKHLLQLHPDHSGFTFFAPTVFLYNSFEEIISTPSGMQVTPHITKALAKSAVLDDKRILNVGMFHAGSWTFNRSEESLRFLDWWAERTLDRAKFDLCNGMCMDQLWLNFVLVRIPDAIQISNPGWHYGLHSVLNKALELKDQTYLVEGEKLISADFAGLDFFDPIWSDHAPLLKNSGLYKTLYSDYKKIVNSFKQFVPGGKPGFGKNPDIKPDRLFRKRWRTNLKSITQFIDQF